MHRPTESCVSKILYSLQHRSWSESHENEYEGLGLIS